MDKLTIKKGNLLLDIGCGFGAWTNLAAELYGCKGTGIDHNPEAIKRAKAKGTSVKYHVVNANELDPIQYDGILCIGSTHALGGLEGTLEFCRTRLKPGAKLLIGEGFWAKKPEAAYLEKLGGSDDQFSTHAENALRITNAGYRLWYSSASSQDDWDEYEGRYRYSIVEWCENNPSDPEASDYLARSDSWYDAYLRWGRETLGFGFYVASLDTSQLK